MTNKREVWVSLASGDQMLVEIAEQYGWIMLSADGARMDLDPDSVFDLIDALTMVANEMSSHVEEE